jgi:hypothetical protein
MNTLWQQVAKHVKVLASFVSFCPLTVSQITSLMFYTSIIRLVAVHSKRRWRLKSIVRDLAKPLKKNSISILESFGAFYVIRLRLRDYTYGPLKRFDDGSDVGLMLELENRDLQSPKPSSCQQLCVGSILVKRLGSTSQIAVIEKVKHLLLYSLYKSTGFV